MLCPALDDDLVATHAHTGRGRCAARHGTGETLEEAADALQVSLGTARNQLKAIISKTETSRQAELVALLWRASDLAFSFLILPP
jgi:DNA-binding CsgD family transcriptional regulator